MVASDASLQTSRERENVCVRERVCVCECVCV